MTTKGDYIIKDNSIENIIFDYMDEFKFLLFPEKWRNVFLDYSKNEILSLILIYRKKIVTMSEVAEYINAPLNTATGVITRLEKSKMVERNRDQEDKRIVRISLTTQGSEYIEEEKSLIEKYMVELYQSLTEEEIKTGISIIGKLIQILKKSKEDKQEEKSVKPIRKITIE